MISLGRIVGGATRIFCHARPAGFKPLRAMIPEAHWTASFHARTFDAQAWIGFAAARVLT
jgi:hypothetical protein